VPRVPGGRDRKQARVLSTDDADDTDEKDEENILPTFVYLTNVEMK
jgi:hypothetical protein